MRLKSNCARMYKRSSKDRNELCTETLLIISFSEKWLGEQINEQRCFR